MTGPRIYTGAEARGLLQHTLSGPWRFERHHDDQYGWHYCVQNDEFAVAVVADEQGAEEIPDATLIAAAPDLAASVVALEERNAEAIVSLGASCAAFRAELADLRAIIDGRVVPPTDAEIAAHREACGYWRFVTEADEDGTCETAEDVHESARTDVPWPRTPAARWWAHDFSGRPCAWPVVAPEVTP